jgi:hypothetical protein
MDYAQLLQDMHTSPSVKLIKSDNVAFTVSFLYQEYKKDVQGRHNDTVPYQTLVEHLETYLKKLNAEDPTLIRAAHRNICAIGWTVATSASTLILAYVRKWSNSLPTPTGYWLARRQSSACDRISRCVEIDHPGV